MVVTISKEGLVTKCIESYVAGNRLIIEVYDDYQM